MMDHQLLVISQGTLPIHVQLKEQIKWLIVQGQLQSGDLLPSVRDLSKTLGVNRNTINAVYDELRGEGLITMGRGRGAEIANNEKVRQLPRLKELLVMLDEAFHRAQQHGFTQQEVGMAAQVRGQLLMALPPQEGSVTFIECGEHELDFYLAQIRDLTGRSVRFLSLSDFKQDPKLAGNLVVTTVFHANEVRALLRPETTLAVIGALPVLRTVMELAQLPPGSKVAFVCRGMAGGLWMEGSVKGADLSHLHLEATGFREPDAEEVLRKATVIYASPSVYQQVVERMGDPNRVRLFNMALDATSRETLKSTLAPADSKSST